jgi:hypothetical protein
MAVVDRPGPAGDEVIQHTPKELLSHVSFAIANPIFVTVKLLHRRV